MAAALVVDALILAWVLYRQRHVRLVRRRLSQTGPVLLGLIGVVEIVDFSHAHPISLSVAGVLVLTLAVAAAGFGVLRAWTVRLWVDGGMLLRQGTWLTIALWLVSIGLHFAAEAWVAALRGPTGLLSAAFLLYVAITFGVQRAVVHHRAMSLAARGEAIEARAEDVTGRRRRRGPREPHGSQPQRGGGAGTGSEGRRAPGVIEASAEVVDHPRSHQEGGEGDGEGDRRSGADHDRHGRDGRHPDPERRTGGGGRAT